MMYMKIVNTPGGKNGKQIVCTAFHPIYGAITDLFQVQPSVAQIAGMIHRFENMTRLAGIPVVANHQLAALDLVFDHNHPIESYEKSMKECSVVMQGSAYEILPGFGGFETREQQLFNQEIERQFQR